MYELTLTPAYGRDYADEAAVIRDWVAAKDFKVATIVSPYCGKYTSVRDLAKFPGEQVKIRFDKLTRFILVDTKTGAIHGESDSDRTRDSRESRSQELVSDHALQSERDDALFD
jgi:hypothetical protein